MQKVLERAHARIVLPVVTAVLAAGIFIGAAEHTEYVGNAPIVKHVAAAAALPVTPVAASADTHQTAAARDSDQFTRVGDRVSTLGLSVGLSSPHVDKWVQKLSTTLKTDVGIALDRMSNYADMITDKLAERNMPQGLVYLAMIESEFNPNAKSPASAVGLWQFMSGTARQYGLKVGRRVDERRDPEKSTDAALAFLSQLYDRFGSWYLAAAAYNSGAGTVTKALQRTTGKTTGTDEDFFRIMPRLPRETQDYVPKLIATAKVASDPAAYGVTPVAAVSTQTSAVAHITRRSAPSIHRATINRPRMRASIKRSRMRASVSRRRVRASFNRSRVKTHARATNRKL